MSNTWNDYWNQYLKNRWEWVEGEGRIVSVNGPCFPVSLVRGKISVTTQHPGGLPVGDIFLIFHLPPRTDTCFMLLDSANQWIFSWKMLSLHPKKRILMAFSLSEKWPPKSWHLVNPMYVNGIISMHLQNKSTNFAKFLTVTVVNFNFYWHAFTLFWHGGWIW